MYKFYSNIHKKCYITIPYYTFLVIHPRRYLFLIFRSKIIWHISLGRVKMIKLTKDVFKRYFKNKIKQNLINFCIFHIKNYK